ncbi:polysaccharide biosynthesis/export family protein [Leptothoe spongobia]|uniref:Polysaccharide biosynthesis/export family protein n=1 Tax=Leptothoe spongobia TAU-MAC 1115 TaxID=1967444 RepID=A0A947DHV5_9CYAN|nr:polysaccharide biosynthesis/export family protein [Leptothoe spongobia]MBT9317467.1 polysaccharide biosynthesis/export family protein [Leptothoe spongobia TAU-MAC 1115]
MAETPEVTPSQFSQGISSYDYLLGSGDQIAIEVVGYPEFADNHVVLPDGTISIPLIGPVQASGRTLSSLANAIENQLGSSYLVNPIVDLSLLTLRPISVTLSGEVHRPGPLLLDSLQTNRNEGPNTGRGPTLVNALIEAGGVTNFADIREITVRRFDANGRPETIALNFWDSLVSEPTAINLMLRDGDSIIVPRLSPEESLDRTLIARSTIAPGTIRVKVVGEVMNPGEVQVTPDSTLSSAIATAGGPTDDAKLRKVAFIRMDEYENVTTQELDLRNLTDSIQVQDGDVIIVPKTGVSTGLDFATRLLNPLRFFTDIWRILD